MSAITHDSLWSIGTLAKLTHVSIRALRHYHKLGLLIPSSRNKAGYRFYNANDLEHLQLIRSLQMIGLSLAEIKIVMQKKTTSLIQVLLWQSDRLQQSLQNQKRLCDLLEAMIKRLDQHNPLSPQDFIHLIQLMNYPQPAFNDEEKAKIQAQGQKLGQDQIKAVELAWPVLIAAVQKAMDQKLDSKSSHVQKLGQEWQSLVNQFTGGDPSISTKLKKAYQEHKGFTGGPTPVMMEYIDKALNNS